MWKVLKWRRWNRLRARIGGYFWLPCPLCGQMFGGHEWKNGLNGESSVIWEIESSGMRRGRGIGPTCTLAGKGDM